MEDTPSGQEWSADRLGGDVEHWGTTEVEMAPGALKTERPDKGASSALSARGPVRCCLEGTGSRETPGFSISGPDCPAGMEYKECVSPCHRTCRSLSITEVCREQCVDGCSCPGNRCPTLFTNLRPRQCPWLREARRRLLVFHR